MIVHPPESDTKRARSGDCGCGGKCGGGGNCGCESRCCDLECVVRPNFFCGQVLSDTDLGAMVEWTRNRFALTRYRHGWGVACGLDVTCSHPRGGDDCCPDPGRGPRVYVSPGYAIDCCGNDLVVCEPIAVDLGDVCRPLDDPCGPPAKATTAAVPAANAADVRRGLEARFGVVIPVPVDETPDCLKNFGKGLFAVNLTLRYHEDMAQGQRAMFRSGCSDVGSCEYSRVLESPCVHAELGALGCDDDDGYKSWDKEFTSRRTKAQAAVAAAFKQGPEASLRYLRRDPLRKFCFVEELICCLASEYGTPAVKNAWQDINEMLRFWINFEWLLNELECPCWSCRPDSGVPIARVLLKRVEVKGEVTCRVYAIDSTAPHRRALHKDSCRPIPRGAIDLASYLWQRADELDQLRSLGVAVKVDTNPSESLYADLLSSLENPRLVLLPGESRSLVALIIKDLFQCDRVAGFVPADDQ